MDSSGNFLLGQRTNYKSWSGWWEFPGGKLEKYETPIKALNREIHEELGVKIINPEKWVTRSFSYDDLDVILYFFKVFRWEGEIQSKEGQPLVWSNIEKLDISFILPPNQFVIKAIHLPNYYAITNLFETTLDSFMSQLTSKIKGGIKLIQVREKHLSCKEYKDFANKIIDLSKPQGVKVMINSDINLAYELLADGVHLNSIQLHKIKEFPRDLVVGVSCHTKEDLDVAEEKGADFAVLSPVNETLSHPNRTAMGWKGFKELVTEYSLPVYALGGMSQHDIDEAQRCGGIGIASQRSIWLD